MDQNGGMPSLSTLPRLVRATVRETRGRDLPPGPPGDPLLGHYRWMVGDRAEAMLDAFTKYGDVVRMHFLGRRVLLFAHPDAVEEILLKKHRLYGKQTPGYARMREFMGNGLLTSEGAFWRRQRRIAQPAFHRKRISGFADAMVRAAADRIEDWERAAETGRVVDVAEDMMAVTLRIVGETLLSSDPTDRAQEIAAAIDAVLHGATERINRPGALPLSVPTRANRRYRRAAETLDRLVFGLIEARRRGERRDDLLQMLLEARDEETGERMNDQQLRDEVMTMFLAGHETTANMLTWTLYLLSKAPAYARRVVAEAQAVLGDRNPSFEDVAKLTFTKQVLQESMRVLPPVWAIGRSPEEDDVVQGVTVPKGTLVFLICYVTHRHPDFWEKPEVFDPDRWTPERVARQHRAQYFPFAAGPRMCIGSGFAMMEAQLMLPMFLRRYRFDLVPSHRVEKETLITMRPRFGMRMTLHPR